MKKFSNNIKGITLIALVVTIIVLLILAGISISMLSGDNGILQKATEANEKNGEAQIKEEIGLAWNGVQTEGIVKGWTLDQKVGALQTELKKEDSSATATTSGNNINVKNYKGYDAIIDTTNGSFRSFAKSKGNIGGATGTLILNTTVRETESRAAVIEVSVEAGEAPTEAELQAKSEEALQTIFVNAYKNDMKQQGASDYYISTVTWESLNEESIESLNNDSGFLSYFASKNCSNIYEYIIVYYAGMPSTIKCNSETIIGMSAEFVVTKNGSYTISATQGEESGTTTIEVEQCKIEEYSSIQVSNYKLEKDGYEVWIPAGFAYGTSENVGTVTTGLVITDSVEQIDGKNYSNGNEFVWIPIDKDNLTVGKTNKKMAEISAGANYRGLLYIWNRDQTGNTCYDPSLGRKEPAYLTYSDNNSLNNTGISDTKLQQDYNNLIASIMEYGGFYVARYEMGDSPSNISRLNVTPDQDINWWNAYNKAKAYNKNGVTSGMVWGSQWDAMLNFGLTNTTDSSKVTVETNGNHTNKILNTGMWLGSNNQTDRINNIFDLEGNVREWTMTAAIDGDGSSWSTSRRIVRGGSAKYSCPATSDGSHYPGDVEDSYLYGDYFCTRIMLYIDV